MTVISWFLIQPAIFPLSHIILPFLASWLEYLIFSPCTTGIKKQGDSFILGMRKIKIGIVCEWTKGPKYFLRDKERYFGVYLNL